MANGRSAFGVSETVLSGFVRIVTNARIFPEPTPTSPASKRCVGRILSMRTKSTERENPYRIPTAINVFQHSLPGLETGFAACACANQQLFSGSLIDDLITARLLIGIMVRIS